MGKYALIIHGWPQVIPESHILYTLLKKAGYTIIQPHLFKQGEEFSYESSVNSIKESIRDKDIEIAIGVSMGGLILGSIPNLNQLKRARFIFIATGPRFKPKSRFFNFLLRIVHCKYLPEPNSIIKFIPRKILESAYTKISPYNSRNGQLSYYLEDMRINLSLLTKFTKRDLQQISKTVVKIDNTKNLSNIKNKCLIISGLNDSLMPLNLGEEMHSLIPNSTIYRSNGSGHFGVINIDSQHILKSFINSIQKSPK